MIYFVRKTGLFWPVFFLVVGFCLYFFLGVFGMIEEKIGVLFMLVFIFFYLWIVLIVIGIFCFFIVYWIMGKKCLIFGFVMIVLSIVFLIMGFWIGGVNYYVFIGGMFLFGMLLVGFVFLFFFVFLCK